MSISRVKRTFLLSIIVLVASVSASNSFASGSQEMRGGSVPGTCEEVVIELARFKDVWTEWGTTQEGDPWSSTRHSSAGGEWFADGVTIYKSKSRFNRRVRQINEDVKGLAGRKPLFDEKGHQIGQRVAKEIPADGKVTGFLIWLITDRKIVGISATSRKLALTVEKADSLPGGISTPLGQVAEPGVTHPCTIRGMIKTNDR